MSELIDTLRDALKEALDIPRPLTDKTARYHDALQLLSTPDALAWALLEEMAERVVVVGVCAGDLDFKWAALGETLQVSSTGLGLFLNRWQDGFEDPIDDFFVGSPEAARMVILCLARAVKEQEGRVQDDGTP